MGNSCTKILRILASGSREVDVSKVFYIFSAGVRFVQWRKTICAILVEGIISNISINYFEFGLVVQKMQQK